MRECLTPKIFSPSSTKCGKKSFRYNNPEVCPYNQSRTSNGTVRYSHERPRARKTTVPNLGKDQTINNNTVSSLISTPSITVKKKPLPYENSVTRQRRPSLLLHSNSPKHFRSSIHHEAKERKAAKAFKLLKSTKFHDFRRWKYMAP